MNSEQFQWGIAGDPVRWIRGRTLDYAGRWAEEFILVSSESDIQYALTVRGNETVLDAFVDAVQGLEAQEYDNDYIRAYGDACETLHNVYYEYLAHTYHGKKCVRLKYNNVEVTVSSFRRHDPSLKIRSSRREIFDSSRRYQKASRLTKRAHVRLQIPSFRERYLSSDVVVCRNFPFTNLEKCIAWSIALDYADNGCLGRTDCCNGGEQ